MHWGGVLIVGTPIMPSTPDSLGAEILQKAVLRYHFRKILHINDTGDYFLLHWRPPTDTPEDGSYVLLKCLDTDGKTIDSCPASYENGHFYDLLNSNADCVINPAIILGWTYYPYDERMPQLI